MVDAGRQGCRIWGQLTRGVPQGSGDVMGARRIADLVVHDRQLFACLGKPQHRLGEVLAIGTVDPGCPEDRVPGIGGGDGGFAGEFGAAIGAGRRRKVGFGIGRLLVAGKDVIGGQVQDRRAGACGGRCEAARTFGIERMRGRLIGFGPVDRRIGGRIDHDGGLGRPHHRFDRCRIGEVEAWPAEGHHIDVCCRRRVHQRARHLSAATSYKDPDLGHDATLLLEA